MHKTFFSSPLLLDSVDELILLHNYRTSARFGQQNILIVVVLSCTVRSKKTENLALINMQSESFYRRKIDTMEKDLVK
jgi:hypothetical protein